MLDMNTIAEKLSENFKTVNNDIEPKLVESAEAIHQGLNGLFSTFIKKDSDLEKITPLILLGTGAHTAWIEAYVNTCSGLLPAGRSSMRRAIEYACYAMKISKSSRRAKNWLLQINDIEHRKKFINEFRIPLSYNSEKYKVLWQLIRFWDMYSTFGAHGNFESIAHTYEQKLKDKTIEIRTSIIATKEESHKETILMLILGYRVLQTFRIALDKFLINTHNLDKTIKYTFEKIRDVRLDTYEERFKETIPADVYKRMYTDDTKFIEEDFKKLIERYEEQRGD